MHDTRGGEDSIAHSAHYDTLLRLARQSIVEYLKTGKYLSFRSDDSWLNSPAAVFVTLRIRSGTSEPSSINAESESGELRGCIGQVEADMPLYRAVQDAAIKAATVDPRFYPVTLDEIDSLSIKISVLSETRLVESLEEITLGRDGLLIAGKRRRGLLLPEVPVMYGWDRVEYLQALCHKAGLSADAWPGRARLYTFGVESFQEE